MARMRHTDTSNTTRRTTSRRAGAFVTGAIAIGFAFALALPTSAYAWNTAPSGGGWHGGGGSWHGGGSSWHGSSMHSHDMHSHDMHSHDHDHTFTSFSLALGFPSYSSPPPYYYPYPYPVYYAPPPVVVPQGAPCRQGQWRQSDGSVVGGVACLGADGNWRLAY